MVLVPEVVDAVAPAPVLAAGGIGCGRQVAAALALGADGVWTGSIWLTVAESDTPRSCSDKLLAATSRDTVRSRSLTGKPARQLKTAVDRGMGRHPSRRARCRCRCSSWRPPTRVAAHPPLRAQRQVRRQGLVGSPVGQIVGRMNAVRPARQVIYEMVEEYVDATTRMSETLAAAEATERRAESK